MAEEYGVSPNEPTGYDRARVARLGPVRDAVEELRLPPLRSRKIGGILNAIEMQIEDGGDSPEANEMLLRALRAAVRQSADRIFWTTDEKLVKKADFTRPLRREAD